MNVKITEAVGTYCFRGECDGKPVAEINVPVNSLLRVKVGDVVSVTEGGTEDQPRYFLDKVVEVGPPLPKSTTGAPPAGLKYEKAATNPNAKAEPAHGKK